MDLFRVLLMLSGVMNVVLVVALAVVRERFRRLDGGFRGFVGAVYEKLLGSDNGKMEAFMEVWKREYLGGGGDDGEK